MSALLEVEDLGMRIRDRHADTTILTGIRVAIHEGECVSLVGESGSGKSMTARTVLRMEPKRAELSGAVRFRGENILQMQPADIQRLRQQQISMIYQDPRSALNPVRRIGDSLIEATVFSGLHTPEQAKAKALDLMHQVHLRDPEGLWTRFPHEFSGGMLQRIMIVASLMNDPVLLLCDEPTSSLDVTNQAEVVAILAELRRSRQLGMLFITHDLDLAAAISDRIAVMYRGEIVEQATAAKIFARPAHPYTRALLAARPRIEGPVTRLRSVAESMIREEMADV